MKSTIEILKLLRSANPDRHVTEDMLRSCLRRGALSPPCIFAGRYAWVAADVRALAAAMKLRCPEFREAIAT